MINWIYLMSADIKGHFVAFELQQLFSVDQPISKLWVFRTASIAKYAQKSICVFFMQIYLNKNIWITNSSNARCGKEYLEILNEVNLKSSAGREDISKQAKYIGIFEYLSYIWWLKTWYLKLSAGEGISKRGGVWLETWYLMS